MKLTKILSKTVKKLHDIPPEAGGVVVSPPSPAPSPTPIVDTAKIQTLGKKLMDICAKRGEPVAEVLEDMVTAYEAGQNAVAAEAPAAAPTSPVVALDGIGETFGALADTFKAMDELKQSLASSIVQPEEITEPTFIEELAGLGVGPQQIQMILSKMGEAKPTNLTPAQKHPELYGGSKYHG